MTTGPPQGAAARKETRYRKSSLVWYHVLDPDPPHETNEGIGAGFDASRSGFGIIVPRPIPLGARVFVHMRCREFELTVVARVTRTRLVDDSQYEIGLQIIVVPPDLRALLSRLFP
jgi:hypothetical protein